MAATQRKVLEGVPRIGFWPDVRGKEDGAHGPEDITWPAVLRACTTYLGEAYDYPYTMTVTGAAFFLNRKPGWHADNSATYYMSSDAAASFVHGFEAVGYDCEIFCGKDFREHEGDMRARIIDSIDRGVPAISHGIIGPPEPTIITGYDEGGDVLIGWSFFQYDPKWTVSVEFEPCGYFRKWNWFQDTYDLLLVGKKGDPPGESRVLCDALAWGIEVARTEVTWKDRHNGLAAFTAWADHISDAGKLENGPDDPFHVHSDAVGTVAETRWYGSRYLADAAARQPKMASELLAAASCFADEHDLMWKVWGCVGSLDRGQKEREAFQKQEMREEMAGLIRRSRGRDEEAITHLARALDRGPGHPASEAPFKH